MLYHKTIPVMLRKINIKMSLINWMKLKILKEQIDETFFLYKSNRLQNSAEIIYF